MLVTTATSATQKTEGSHVEDGIELKKGWHAVCQPFLFNRLT